MLLGGISKIRACHDLIEHLFAILIHRSGLLAEKLNKRNRTSEWHLDSSAGTGDPFKHLARSTWTSQHVKDHHALAVNALLGGGAEQPCGNSLANIQLGEALNKFIKRHRLRNLIAESPVDGIAACGFIRVFGALAELLSQRVNQLLCPCFRKLDASCGHVFSPIKQLGDFRWLQVEGLELVGKLSLGNRRL